MTTEKINDNVGKKIVEALKMHNNFEENYDSDFSDNSVKIEDNTVNNDIISSVDNRNIGFSADDLFQQNINSVLSSEVSNFELPANVAVLTHLITKLPAGVSKQTGALIIKQTMEALGIPMKSVIEEAKNVQDSLTNRARECQKNIIDCKKQISNLEQQAQQYQKQVVSMNDIINLFVNSGL